MTTPHNNQRPPRIPIIAPGKMDCHAADMTAAISASMPLKAVQKQLETFDQWLPVDGDPDTPIGQLIERNSSGPLRLGYGAWRDLLLGMQFINGSGELITAGGATVKNVAGYDLTKFMVGQHGVFGQILTLTTRTYRRPAGAIVAQLPPRTAFINQLLPTPCRPHWALLTSRCLLLGYLGDDSALAWYESTLPVHVPAEIQRRTLDEDVTHRAKLWQTPPGEWAFRAAIPPANLTQFVAQSQPVTWVADAAFGIVLGGYSASPPSTGENQRVHQAAVAAGGSVFDISPEGRVLAQMDINLQPLLERLKTAFDPGNRLQPLPAPLTTP